ncbi:MULTISPECIES: peptide MFS transporter [unclassified Tenacibaculum]|uniref:peptide MFS transporter n=1 Tax=unclassified Tenacibaculum TaxID=2635139 RepID=UPI001F483E64|nr:MULTISPECIES: peptide MFS transporter [unclassified Tenacibaculum]MCF2876204.1 peptide MFS transporter [Tenacibaculum sp. Cn5-1]MCF2936279.1 peptide MFS transporter [Tenacibaculum sp. Cn5-34]MCG7511622.1 peptide MFS transporter [Tenacibaculum sp. Cn5-46]
MKTYTSTTDVFGHPRGLLYLFFAELWERFSFYGMRALLVLYMTKHLLFSDEMSFGIYAAYMSLVYVTPMIGGVLADKILGFRKAIILGGVLMALGHFFLTFEHPVFFYSSLSLIIVGNGFFKPNISSFVGKLYKKEDTRRDAGFTIFYMGVNIGGAVAPLLCAWLAESYGWHYGFVLAGIGMLIGLLVFNNGLKREVFEDHGLIPNEALYNRKSLGIKSGNLVTIGAFLSVPIFALIVRFHQFEHYLVWVVSLFLIVYLSYILKQVTLSERKQLLVAVYFTVLYTLFSAIFEQAGSSLTLFVDRNVNLVLMNAAQTNSINSGFIILLAIPFSMLWIFLNKIKRNPNSVVKFGLGLFFLGLGFVVFGLSAQQVDEFAKTPMFYLVLGTFVYTVGELFLSPIGLSKMTELSPLKYVAFIMGVWFSANFYGHFFAGKIAKLTAVSNGELGVFSKGVFGEVTESVTGLSSDVIMQKTEVFKQLYTYVSVYANFGIIASLIGVLVIIFSLPIKRMMKGVH